MGLGFVIALEREIRGLDPRRFDGWKLAAERHNVDSIAHELDLPGLGEFVAFSHAEAETLAEDMKFDVPTLGSQSGRWFRAADGLEVVRAILHHLEDNPEDVDDLDGITTGLRWLEHCLEEADAKGVRFRLTVEY